MKTIEFWHAARVRRTLLACLCAATFSAFSLPLAQASGTGTAAQQQERKLTILGKVLDTEGAPLYGAAVIVKGTNNGVMTDSDGNYLIKNVPLGSELEFSYVSFVTVTKKVDGAEVVNAILYEDAEMLEGVQVVAFGTQKKESVIGSITSVNAAELKTPSSNLTNSFAGRMAGVISYQRSGEPGVDDASFFVRGVTTFGYKKDPLILIDGIELTSKDLARLQPDDISNFSIMKDATATALYGARGANGVILVNTKQGQKGKAKLNIRIENSISAPTQEIELADPITYMRLHNEAYLTRNPLAPLMYSEEKIDNTVPGSGSVIYPSTDWQKELLKDYTMNRRYNMNISGGGDVARYYVAASFSQDNGILQVDKNNNFNSNIRQRVYTLRSNVNINVTKTTEMIVRLSAVFDEYNGPLYGGASMYNLIMKSNPVLFPAKYPVDEAHTFTKHTMFGNAENGQYLNPYAEMVRGYKETGRANIGAQFEVKQDFGFITKGLTARFLLNATRISSYDLARKYNPYYYFMTKYDYRTGDYAIDVLNPDEGTEYLLYSPGAKSITANMYTEAALNYNREFGKHGLSGLLVYQMRNNVQPNAGTLQSSLPYRNLGLSGRFTYSFDNRYFLEYNFGYNGSERFHKKNRFGFFPSAGLAWVVSNEKFWEPVKKTVNNFKLRASYGMVGNDAIGSGRFLYLSDINMNNATYGSTFGYNFDYKRNGISITRYSDPDITWEKSAKANYALELGLFDSLNLIAEYYTEHRTSILQQRAAVPATMGLWTKPYANLGEAKGSGVDLSLDYNKYFSNGAWLQLRGNFTYAKSKFIAYEDYEYPGAWWKNRVGYSTNQTWGYIAEGLFVDDNEVRNSPAQFGEYKAGDIKYRDVNRDGKITDLDMVPIGFPKEPEIVYGFGASFGFKSFDFSVFFQGLARESFWINYINVSPFYNTVDTGLVGSRVGHNALAQFIADDYWSEENRDAYAVWPRLSISPVENNNKTSTWFMRDGTFLRLKQLEVGYTLPEKVSNLAGIKSFRIYLSGNNLLCFSKFKLWDPEMAGSGLGYPVQRVYNIGVNLNF